MMLEEYEKGVNMAINQEKTYLITLLQENLQAIRKIAGWTIDDLGEKIGVSKQTISNLENSNTKMSLVQYIAIRVILDYETQRHPENDVLAKSIYLLLDEGHTFQEHEYAKLKEAIEAVAAAAAAGTDEVMLSKLFSGVVDAIANDNGLNIFLSSRERFDEMPPQWLTTIMDMDEER